MTESQSGRVLGEGRDKAQFDRIPARSEIRGLGADNSMKPRIDPAVRRPTAQWTVSQNSVQLSDSCTSDLMRLLKNEFSTDF